jgi:hypothetical protein
VATAAAIAVSLVRVVRHEGAPAVRFVALARWS